MDSLPELLVPANMRVPSSLTRINRDFSYFSFRRVNVLSDGTEVIHYSCPRNGAPAASADSNSAACQHATAAFIQLRRHSAASATCVRFRQHFIDMQHAPSGSSLSYSDIGAHQLQLSSLSQQQRTSATAQREQLPQR